MNILIFNWRDRKHPQAGGAERVTEEFATRWVKWGHSVTLLTSMFPGAKPKEIINGVHIIRGGSQMTVHWHAFRYYQNFLREKFDVVIDEVNTIPFFTPLYVNGDTRCFALFHQLCREIWFYEFRAPGLLQKFAYWLEPHYLKLYRNIPTLAMSDSTLADLQAIGIKNITIYAKGIDDIHLPVLPPKTLSPHFIFVGRQVPSKRVDEVIKAFAIFCKQYQYINAPQLDLVGFCPDLDYAQYLQDLVRQQGLEQKVIFHGSVSESSKLALMKQASLLLVTSVREGWGLVVTEANALGTPAIVYDVPGLRDSVQHEKTGLITSATTPNALASAMLHAVHSPNLYNQLRYAAWEYSKLFTWDKAASETLTILEAFGRILQ